MNTLQWNIFLQHHRSPVPDTCMLLISLMGSRYCFMAVLPVLYWTTRRRKAWFLTTLFMMSMELNAILKIRFHRMRPFQLDDSICLIGPMPHTWAFPSGHAQGSVSLWGGIALAFPYPLLIAAAAVLIVLIGLSRLYLGVHSIGDVLFGWLLGFAECGVLYLLIYGKAHWNSLFRSTTMRIFSGGAALSGMILFPKKDVLISGTVLIALLLLEPLERTWIRFEDATEASQRFCRLIIGFFPAGILFFLYKTICSPTLPIHLLMFSFLGAWMVLGAPWFFHKYSF